MHYASLGALETHDFGFIKSVGQLMTLSDGTTDVKYARTT